MIPYDSLFLHGELVTFNFHFPQIPNVCIVLIVGPGGHVHDPQNQFSLTLDSHIYFKKYKKIPNHSWEISLLVISKCPNQQVRDNAARHVLEVKMFVILFFH